MRSVWVWAIAGLAAAVVAAAILWFFPTGTDIIEGDASIPRPGVLEIGGVRVHLLGLQPPREDADCRANGVIYQCTLLHQARIAEMIAGRRVRCDVQKFRGDERVWGTCRTEDAAESVNRQLVRAGWAFADTTRTEAYAGDGTIARRSRQGIWAGLVNRRSLLDRDVLLGNPTVKDAGTLEISEIDIHLYGIDAPVLQQTCTIDEIPYQCGLLAHAYLLDLVSGTTVVCHVRQFEGDERVYGVCGVSDGSPRGMVDGLLTANAQMVELGWAVAKRAENIDLTAHERIAREQRAGMWAGEFVRPSNWLAGRR